MNHAELLHDLDLPPVPAHELERDRARARLGQLRETREWAAIFRELAARRERGLPELGAGARAILRQECLDFYERRRPPHGEWVELVARLLTEPSPVSEQKRAMQDYVATILERDGVPRAARRSLVELVLSRGAQRPECAPLLRLMARVTRSLVITEARPFLREILSSGPRSPEVLIDLLQALARVGRSEDISVVGLHLESDSPGVAQTAFDAVIQLSNDFYAAKTLLLERPPANAPGIDGIRAALVRTRFALPRGLVLFALTWVLRFERGPRARASLIDVIAREGGPSAIGALVGELAKLPSGPQSRDERERIRAALAAIPARPRAWRKAARSADAFVQALGWSRRRGFGPARRQWARLSLFLKIRLLESARDLTDPGSRDFLEWAYATQTGATRLKAQQALAARADAQVSAQLERLRADERTYGRSEVLIELAENLRAELSPALAEFCVDLSDVGPALAYAKVRAALRLQDPMLVERVVVAVAGFKGCLRERCVELLGDAIQQEVVELARLSEAAFAPPVWPEILARLNSANLSDRQWEDLLLAARRSGAVRDFVASRELFWRGGVRSVIRGFMSRERWGELRRSIEGFAGMIPPDQLGQVRREMDLREGRA